MLKAWEGLGYYRRARQLQAAAQSDRGDARRCCPRGCDGRPPLPGVGPYIAGAVLSFAFDRPEPIVEANSQRVLARLLALDADLKSSAGSRRVWEAAARLVPPAPGDFNQASMDLGALICTPRQPGCLVCPLSSWCRGRWARAPGRAPPIDSEADAGRGLRGLRPGPSTEPGAGCPPRAGRLWEQFWEFPTIHVNGPDPARRSFGDAVGLAEGVRRLAGVNAEIGPPSATIRYAVTNYRVTLTVSRGEARSGRPRPGPGLIDARSGRARTAGGVDLQLGRASPDCPHSEGPGWPEVGA